MWSDPDLNSQYTLQTWRCYVSGFQITHYNSRMLQQNVEQHMRQSAVCFCSFALEPDKKKKTDGIL